MATQLQSVTGRRRLKRNQIAELEARMSQLPSILQAKQNRELQGKQEQLQNRQLAQSERHAKKSFGLKKDALAAQQDAAEKGMGVSAGKFGFNLATSDGPTIGEIGTKISGAFGGGPKTSFQPPGTTNRGMTKLSTSANKGYFSGLQPGKLIGSGLAGFGASRFVKGKGKRALLGAGVGGLMSLFGGGGFSPMGALSGALFGGLGGLV